MSKMIKILLIIVTVILVASAIYFIFFYSKENEIMPGSDRDKHGCIGSAGYSWCEAKQKCLRSWEEECK